MDYYETITVYPSSSHSSTDSITPDGNNHRHKYSYRSSIIDGSRLFNRRNAPNFHEEGVMIKKQILYETIGYLQLRVLKDTHRKDKYDITFLSTEYPEWRIWHKNVDNLKCRELLFMYKLRSYLFRLLPPKITHWLITG